ncbi:MAG: glutaredoxin family protein [Deltaproteobacteria bacterium]|nr:glutaredoxin family protein [Deltaproteobacteria bacterium]
MAPHVTLYVKDGCAHCDRARAALVARGAPFTEIDVSRHPEIVPELLKLTSGRRVVPVTVEGARITVAGDGGSTF